MLWVVVLLVLLEDGHQVWQFDVQLVQAELELQGWNLDELLLLSLVVLLVTILVGNNADNHGEESKEDDDLDWVESRWWLR